MFFVLGLMSACSAQSYKTALKRLSSAERFWLYTHPFKAKRAYRVSKEINVVVDSIKKTRSLGGHHVGNQLDAFKHAYWVWSLAEEIGWRSALSLGKAHEKGNYEYYKENKKEDGVLPDKVSSEMDLHNNSMGITLYKKHKHVSKKLRIAFVKQAVLEGKMKMIYQTKNRKYLDNKGNVIARERYYGLWENPKILVSSKTKYLLGENKSK